MYGVATHPGGISGGAICQGRRGGSSEWWTHGPYDLVVVGEWPDDGAVSVTALSVEMRGNLRGGLMWAVTPEEMQDIVQRLP